jgi:hypothetical protein
VAAVDKRLRTLLTAAAALGILVLAAVPVHAALRADPDVLAHEDYLEPACRVPFQIVPEPVCPRAVAGESPATVLFALVLVPLLAWGLRPQRLLALAILSGGWALVQVAGPFLFTFRPVSGEAPSPIEPESGCGLVNCGLDHTVFHLIQLPFLIAIAVLSYRLYRARLAEAP